MDVIQAFLNAYANLNSDDAASLQDGIVVLLERHGISYYWENGRIRVGPYAEGHYLSQLKRVGTPVPLG